MDRRPATWTLIVLSVLLYPGDVHASRVIHTVVALCDNVHQGIVPVPAAIGNGQDPGRNLYWGCGFGVRTHFNKAVEWRRVHTAKDSARHVLERIVWKHVTADVYLVADAYDGAYIEEAIRDMLRYCCGRDTLALTINGVTVHAGGASNLVAYVGHDGLMEFPPPPLPTPVGPGAREAIVLACSSRTFFSGPLARTGAAPLLWTTGLMAPEAYTLKDALDGWVLKESGAAIAERAAQAYDRHQHCGIKGARRLLVTGW